MRELRRPEHVDAPLPVILMAFCDPDKDVRSEAMRFLGSMGHIERAAAALKTASGIAITAYDRAQAGLKSMVLALLASDDLLARLRNDQFAVVRTALMVKIFQLSGDVCEARTLLALLDHQPVDPPALGPVPRCDRRDQVTAIECLLASPHPKASEVLLEALNALDDGSQLLCAEVIKGSSMPRAKEKRLMSKAIKAIRKAADNAAKEAAHQRIWEQQEHAREELREKYSRSSSPYSSGGSDRAVTN